MVVPCGNCAFCSATKRSDWALRLHMEGRKHIVKRFVTLTYANPHLVWNNGVSQLCKRHVQLWLKKVRRSGAKVRYFAVGEYGSKTFRPHYHVLLFGDVPEEVLRSSWSFGHVHIGQVTEASVMYCLGYTIHGAKKGNRRPFTLMSKGLGKSYINRATIGWHKEGWKNYVMIYNEKRALPRYYKRKIFTAREMMFMRMREAKQSWEREVAIIRKLCKKKIRDPQQYRLLQKIALAKSIRLKSKEQLII